MEYLWHSKLNWSVPSCNIPNLVMVTLPPQNEHNSTELLKWQREQHLNIVQLLNWSQPAHKLLLFVTEDVISLLLKKPVISYYWTSNWPADWYHLLAVFEALHQIGLKFCFLSLFAAICSPSLGVKQLLNFPNISSPLVLYFRFFFPLQCRKGTTKPPNTLNYLLGHGRRKGNFPKWHTVPWMFMPKSNTRITFTLSSS